MHLTFYGSCDYKRSNRQGKGITEIYCELFVLMKAPGAIKNAISDGVGRLEHGTYVLPHSRVRQLCDRDQYEPLDLLTPYQGFTSFTTRILNDPGIAFGFFPAAPGGNSAVGR